MNVHTVATQRGSAAAPRTAAGPRARGRPVPGDEAPSHAGGISLAAVLGGLLLGAERDPTRRWQQPHPGSPEGIGR